MITAAARGDYALGKIAAGWNAAGMFTSRGNKWTGHKVGDMLRNPLRHEHPDAPGRGIRTELQGNLYGRPAATSPRTCGSGGTRRCSTPPPPPRCSPR